MTPAELENSVLEGLKRNNGRDHTPDEFVLDLKVPMPNVMGALEALVTRGLAAKREWTGGTQVYGLPEKAAV